MTQKPKSTGLVLADVSPNELPPLPYADSALAPHISSNTLGFHYGKHHSAYVNNTKKLIAGSDLADLPLEEVVRETAGKPDRASVFNNAAQAWNHTFYWRSMRPQGGGMPSGRLKERIEQDLGGFETFKTDFSTAATTLFGSGWAWLAVEGGKLKILRTSNADTPVARGIVPLLTLDVWEHAYYLDYQNRRADYVAAYLANLVNWEFAAENLARSAP